MRTKLMVGLFGMAIVAFFAGDYLFNRSSGAQEPSSGTQLFEKLKKDLDAKKDVVLPALPSQQPDGGVTIPPVVEAPKPVPTPFAVEPTPAQPKPAGVTQSVYVPQVDAPPPSLPGKPTPMPDVKPVFPPLRTQQSSVGTDTPPLSNPQEPPVTPIVPPTKPLPSPTPPSPDVSRTPRPTDGIQYQLVVPANPKASPWSFQVDVVDNQTIVTATVHRKHAFKIVCKHLDLQTEQGTLKARGNVQITGDALEGACASLSIPLTDDRLVLEGSAEVRIRKTTMAVSYASDARPAQFELKGETLNLRISELLTGKYLQTSLTQASLPGPSKLSTGMMTTAGGANWSPYGKLRQTKEMHGDLSVWCLENNNGQPICRFVTREGGSLNQYIGQTIGVHLEAIGNGMSRVTHIALP